MDFTRAELKPLHASFRRGFHTECRSFGSRVVLMALILLNVSLLFVLLISVSGLSSPTLVVYSLPEAAAPPPPGSPADRAAAHSVTKRDVNLLQRQTSPAVKEGQPANSTASAPPALSVPSAHRSFQSTTQRADPTTKLLLLHRAARNSKWQLFTNQSLWDVDHKDRQLGMDGATGADLRAAVAAAVQQLNAALPPHRRNYSHHHLLEGRFRTEPAVGTEYLLQLTSLTRPKAVETVRVTRPASDLQASLLPAYSPSQLIYLVVPYYARPQSLAKFAVQFADLVTAAGENIQMALLFHWSGRPVVSNDQLKQDFARTATALSRINKRVGRQVARLISVKKPFSRGQALLEGAASWGSPGDVLLFLCDVDMVINSRALQRCRANTVAGHSVYYPIVFSTYNPRIFARARRKETQSLWQYHPIDKSVGFWRDFGYGMTCQYKSDFDAVAGSYLIRNSWGGEDLDLFMHYYHKKYDVVRVPDPDMVHVYHPKLCEQAGKLLGSCQNSRIETEASKDTWAKFIYELKQAEANPQELGELLALVKMRDTATTSKTTSATAITNASTAPSNSGNRTTGRLRTPEILTRLFSLPRISHKPHRNTSRTSLPLR